MDPGWMLGPDDPKDGDISCPLCIPRPRDVNERASQDAVYPLQEHRRRGPVSLVSPYKGTQKASRVHTDIVATTSRAPPTYSGFVFKKSISNDQLLAIDTKFGKLKSSSTNSRKAAPGRTVSCSGYLTYFNTLPLVRFILDFRAQPRKANLANVRCKQSTLGDDDGTSARGG